MNLVVRGASLIDGGGNGLRMTRIRASVIEDVVANGNSAANVLLEHLTGTRVARLTNAGGRGGDENFLDLTTYWR